MKKRNHTRVVFKTYTQDQPQLLATDLNELVAANHLARVVSGILDRIDLGKLKETYVGGGASAYDPLMLLKVMVYCYLQGVYTTRRIAKACREDLPTMYLAGRARPGFRTFGSFRSSRLVKVLETIFAEVVKQLIASGHVSLETLFVDGSKIAAGVNPARMQWAKRVKKNQEQVEEKIRAVLQQAEQEAAEEDARLGERDLEELGEDATPLAEQDLEEALKTLNEKIRQTLLEQPAAPRPKPSEPLPLTPMEAELERLREQAPAAEDQGSVDAIEAEIERLQTRLEQRPGGKRLKKTLETLRAKVRRQIEIRQTQRRLAGRSGCSSIDPDASPMRLKEDRAAARQPRSRPAYNTQIGVSGQYILSYSVHQAADDTSCLGPHLARFQADYGCLPQAVVTDSGYGSEENYALLERSGVEAFVKYSTFYYDLRGKPRPSRADKTRFYREQFVYQPEADAFTCPAGQTLTFDQVEGRVTATGYLTRPRTYATPACTTCPLKSECTQGKGGRVITYNPTLEAYRAQARERLTSERGQVLRAQRSVQVETVFAAIKHNHRFRRFHLRSLPKVSTEWGLICIAHNLRKRASA